MTTKAIQSAAPNAAGPCVFVENPPVVQPLISRVAELATCSHQPSHELSDFNALCRNEG